MLYPAPLRDFLIELAAAGLFHARWTEEIHEEWTRNVLKDRTDLRAEQLERTRELMNRAVPDCLVANYGPLIEGLELPDPNDRHVLAAAIRSGSEAIVTFNLRDFPEPYLALFGIEALHPDKFIYHQFGSNAANVLIAAHRCRERLKNPPKSANEYLDILEKQGLPQSAGELRKYSTVI